MRVVPFAGQPGPESSVEVGDFPDVMPDVGPLLFDPITERPVAIDEYASVFERKIANPLGDVEGQIAASLGPAHRRPVLHRQDFPG
jgi:hypothetical protein